MGGLNALDICAGSGIGSAVWRTLGGRTVCYVERDAYCQRLLQARMRDGLICDAPVWDDLRTFDGRPWRGIVDFMFGGIPCQPYSVAGKQQGDADERDLWPDFRRVLCEIRPRFALVENVSGFLAHGGGLARVLGELAEDGYGAEWAMLAAEDVGAPHRRQRVWICAYPCGETGRVAYGGAEAGCDLPRPLPDVPFAGNSRPSRAGRGHEPEVAVGFAGDGAAEVADATKLLCDGSKHHYQCCCQSTRTVPQPRDSSSHADAPDTSSLGGAAGLPEPEQWEAWFAGEPDDGDTGWACGPSWWGAEPDVGRLAHGVAARVDQLRVLGNGWVPQVAVIPMGRVAQLLGAEVDARQQSLFAEEVPA